MAMGFEWSISLKDFEWSIIQFIIFNISSSAKAVRSAFFILWLLMIMDYSKTIKVLQYAEVSSMTRTC